MGKSTVAILKSEGDYGDLVPRLMELAGAGGLITAGASVLLKPNLHAPQHWSTSGTTHPQLIGALIDWARARGAARIMVADSPYHSHPRPHEVFIETGMAQLVEERGASWAVLTDHPFRVFRDVSPDLPAELHVSELLFRYDRVINVAVCKTHLDAMVTLGIKNLKGCVSKRDKLLFHQELDIPRALVALSRIFHPHLTIVDGTLGMEGLGPASGTVANFGCIFAGTDMLAVDAVAVQAMGFEIDEVPKLKLAQAQGLLDPQQVKVVGEPLAKVTRRFERPYEAMARRLPNVRLSADTACTACKLNLIRSLSDQANRGGKLPERCLVIGNRPSDDPDALLIGKCAKDESGRPYLPGCPPRVDRISAFLSTYGRFSR